MDCDSHGCNKFSCAAEGKKNNTSGTKGQNVLLLAEHPLSSGPNAQIWNFDGPNGRISLLCVDRAPGLLCILGTVSALQLS
jgi:hypothetical protein